MRAKNRRDRLISLARNQPGWTLGFADKVWFSRLVQPSMHAWATAGEPLRLEMHAAARDDPDPDPKALACYGLWLPALPAGERRRLRFVDNRPVSAVTCAFLAWTSERLAAAGVRVLALLWDNASWHTSRAIRSWIKAYNLRVKASQPGCRMLVCGLPGKSPWLNPIERKVGPRQTCHGRANAQAHRRRTQAAALRPLLLSNPPAPRTSGLIIMH
jgi:hypothetical protein